MYYKVLKMTDEGYFNLETGMIAAKSDAHHDFGSRYRSKKQDNSYLVDNELPDFPGKKKNEFDDLNEDNFFEKFILEKGKADALKIKKTDNYDLNEKIEVLSGDNIASSLKEGIRNEYEVVTFRNEKKDENTKDKEPEKKWSLKEIEGKESDIQKFLNGFGINNDVFIICDVAYSWIKKDLLKAKPYPSQQVFWWTQVTQTGFDPAGKTAWHTGKNLGFQDGDDGKSSFKFCWEVADKDGQLQQIYDKWPKDGNNNALTIGKENESSMLCLNKKIMMTSEFDKSNPWDYRKYESYLLIYDDEKKQFIYADKAMAAKEYKMNKGALASYLNKAKVLFTTFINVLRNPGKQNITQKTGEYTLQYHMLAKRCGDMPQALRCLDKSIKFQTLHDAKTKPSKDNVGLPEGLVTKERNILIPGGADGKGAVFQTNGNNMFVSYDRIAVAQALNYRVPIVVYDQKLGVTLFVSRKLLTGLLKLKGVLVEASSDSVSNDIFIYQEKVDGEIKSETRFLLNTSIEFNKLLQDDNKAIKDFNVEMTQMKTKIDTYFTKIQDDGSIYKKLLTNLKLDTNRPEFIVANDDELRGFLKAYFSNIIIIKLLLSVGEEAKQMVSYVNNVNTEFSSLTGMDIKIVDETTYNINIEGFKAGVKNIFDEYVNSKLDTSRVAKGINIDELVTKLVAIATLYNSLTKKFRDLKEKYDKVVLNYLFNITDIELHKDIQSNINAIKPFEPVSLRAFNRMFDQKIYQLSESVFQHEKVIVPIVECVCKIPNEQNHELYEVRNLFYTNMMIYVGKLNSDVLNPNGTFQDTATYREVLSKAIERLGKLFSEKFHQQMGGQAFERKRKVDDNDNSDMEEDDEQIAKRRIVKPRQMKPVPQIYDEPVSNDVFDVYKLIARMKSVKDKMGLEKEFDNVVRFDGLVKNIYNALTFYYDYLWNFKELGENETNVESNLLPDRLKYKDELRELYEKLGKSYLKIEELENVEEGNDMEIDDVKQNDNVTFYLFDALKSQMDNADVTINIPIVKSQDLVINEYESQKTHNFSKLFYLLLNNTLQDGPNQYPGYETILEKLDQFELKNMLGLFSQLNLELLGGLMSDFMNRMNDEIDGLNNEKSMNVSVNQAKVKVPRVGITPPNELPQPVAMTAGNIRRKKTKCKKRNGKKVNRRTKRKMFRRMNKTKKLRNKKKCKKSKRKVRK